MSSNDSQQSRTSLGSHDRKLRYRELLEDLSTLEGDPGNSEECMQKTAAAVKEAQNLLAQGGVEERVKHPGEGYLDSRLLRATSDLALSCSEAVTSNVNQYDKHELAQHIRENPDFWNLPFPLEAPPIGYLFGTFAATPLEQRPRRERRRARPQGQLADLRAPDSIDRLDKTEEGSEMVSRVNRFIVKAHRNNGGKPLSYFHLALDPDSFSRSVENIYRISFLARDGLLSVQLDEEYGLPFVTPVPASQQDQQDPSEEHQFIVSINMKRWQELIQAFNIKKPMMVLKQDHQEN